MNRNKGVRYLRRPLKIIKPAFNFLKRSLKPLKVFIKQKAGWLGVPKIECFRGYGNYSDVYIDGIVIEDKGLSKPLETNPLWKNILAMIKRFSADEIPGVEVKADFMGKSQVVETDEMGFFHFHFAINDISEETLKNHWHPVKISLLDNVIENQPITIARGIVRLVSPDVKRIIVSDIDDTVLVSHSTQTLRKLKLMLFRNAHTRMPFNGVSNLYNALEKGENKQSFYPFFYVSSSEWNLYDLLEDFFDINNLPKGVFMLRRLESSIYKFWKSGQGNHEHKYDKIRFLLNLFDKQHFILIGDSGQKDPEIYRRLALEFPGRIESIYIRKIGSKVYFSNIDKVHSNLGEVNTTYLQVEDTLEAARHAANKNYIHKDYFMEYSKKASEK
jgi:phosphatidate phosphatase APP1